MKNLSDTTIEKLKTLARWTALTDNPREFNPAESSNGNFDEAYAIGAVDGECKLSRSILTELGISWE